ncbi:MAG TPA: chemotaxis protein CheB [Polyangiaceae bacterium]|nr:chemotaxis protein CheB [Polyangiaceae bacterium]
MNKKPRQRRANTGSRGTAKPPTRKASRPSKATSRTARGGEKGERVSRAKREERRALAEGEPAQPAEATGGVEPPRHPASVKPHQDEAIFPIVGVGASAGGLEAIEYFLKHLPDHSGMAFVIVVHLDPTHKGAMVELLQRVTKMPVVEVKDRHEVEPDHVYVIPPGKDMSILRGVLHLLPQVMPRGLNLPIDFFFRSLAADQEERSVGVILSGMGSDGTLGLRAIKEKGGAAFVQSIDSAKFEGMPRSAIEAGVADIVAAVEDLPGKLIAYRQHAGYLVRPDEGLEEKAKSGLEKVYILLRSHTGNDFSLYKKSTIHRRIERRMGLHQIDKLHHYVRYLREHPREIDLLFRELLIGVTSFFRDPAAWDFLRNEAIPALIAARSNGAVLRAWVPGCSTGEEAYSLAIVFKEALEALKASKNVSLQVFATDLDKDAIDRARHAAYPANIAADVSPERLRRFFGQDERGYRVSKEIREMVVFAQQNIIMDPPFTKLDILSCRNLLIYLGPELQKRLIPLFHYSLNPNGILFLGSAETVGTHTGLFGASDNKTRLYRRLEGGAGVAPLEFPAAFNKKSPSTTREELDGRPGTYVWPPTNLQALADQVLLQRFAPAAVLTSDKGDILYISGRTGKYLEPAVGRASMNILAMARDGLRGELSTAFSTALRENRRIAIRGIRVGTNGGTQTVDVTVQKLSEPKELRGTMMVVICDVADDDAVKPHRATPGHRSAHLEQELHRAREEIQMAREEMQTSQEELKSTNEELQSTNEELQSTNEELTTSKEEMQSMNEELQTVNHELQSKLDELSHSNNDMKNLLNSTDIATLFLDCELMVRRFTNPTMSIIKLIQSDAGRSITDIARDVDYPELENDAREVLRTLVFKERLVPATRNRWFTARVMPYRTLENVIDGVVITFTDVSDTKAMEATMRQQASELRQMTESLPHLVWGCQPDGACDYVSPQWVDYTGAAAAELQGFGWLHAVHGDDRDRVRQRWRAGVQSGSPVDVELRLRAKDGSFRWFKLRSVPIHDAQGKVVKWYGTNSDIHDLKLGIEQRKEAADRLISLLQKVSEPFVVLSGGHTISHANLAAQQLLGHRGKEVVGKPLAQVLPESVAAGFHERLRQVVRERREMAFEAHFKQGQNDARFEVRVLPHAEGTAVFFQKQAGGAGTRPTDGESEGRGEG